MNQNIIPRLNRFTGRLFRAALATLTCLVLPVSSSAAKGGKGNGGGGGGGGEDPPTASPPTFDISWIAFEGVATRLFDLNRDGVAVGNLRSLPESDYPAGDGWVRFSDGRFFYIEDLLTAAGFVLPPGLHVANGYEITADLVIGGELANSENARFTYALQLTDDGVNVPMVMSCEIFPTPPGATSTDLIDMSENGILLVSTPGAELNSALWIPGQDPLQFAPRGGEFSPSLFTNPGGLMAVNELGEVLIRELSGNAWDATIVDPWTLAYQVLDRPKKFSVSAADFNDAGIVTAGMTGGAGPVSGRWNGAQWEQISPGNEWSGAGRINGAGEFFGWYAGGQDYLYSDSIGFRFIDDLIAPDQPVLDLDLWINLTGSPSFKGISELNEDGLSLLGGDSRSSDGSGEIYGFVLIPRGPVQ